MTRNGFLYTLGAYTAWGLFPLYWKMLYKVDTVQLIGHRIGWSFVILMFFIILSRQFGAFKESIQSKKVLAIYSVAAILIGVNWLVYIWAVNADFIVETSLGYFINPLLSVLMGVVFLRERLRPFQWVPVGLATLGVIYLAISYGRLPWIGLTLAITFGTYGLVKKISPLGSLFGLTIETGILFLPAVVYLVYADISGSGVFLRHEPLTSMLLVGAGVVTTIPLLMFASAAQVIPLSMIGIMQYIAPTLQFLIGILVYKESFSITQLVGFGIVWLGLLVFILEGFWARRSISVVPIPELGED
jgi:chloramphenicol-sensitive protein RarD